MRLDLVKSANKKLDDYKSSVVLGLSNEICKISIENRGEVFFSICVGDYQNKNDYSKKVRLTNNALNEIDIELAKHKKLSLEGKGQIYIVSDGRYTKIGATTFNPQKRLNELQVGNALNLSLIGSYHSSRRIGTEKMLHDMFKAKHVRGEWFDLSHNEISEILNNRYQSSNSDYQVLCSDDCDSAIFNINLIQNEYSKYSDKIRARFFNKTKCIDELAERWNLWVEKNKRGSVAA